MKNIVIVLLLAVAASTPALPQNSKNPFLGRWDLTVTVGDMKYASWLEVTEKAGKLEARAQQRTGNVAPVARIRLEGERLSVTVAAGRRPAEGKRPAMAARPEIVWSLTEKGGKLSGVSKQGDVTWQLTGAPAPSMKRTAPAAWGAPEPLFNGKDLTGWQPIDNTPEAHDAHFSSHWTVQNGEIGKPGARLQPAHHANLQRFQTARGIQLPARGEQRRLPARPLRDAGRAPAVARTLEAARTGRGGYHNPYGFIGCIYGFLGPASQPPFKPEWQAYDITLVGRMVTVIFNGVTTVDNREIRA